MRPLLLFVCALLSLPAWGDKAPALPDYPLQKIGPNSYLIEGPLGRPSAENQGFMNNPAIILTSAGGVIIDPGSSVQAGEMVLRAFDKVSDKPVVAVFNTHIHGDHWLGNQAIRDAYPDVKIYGHPKMLAQVSQGEGERWQKLLLSMTQGATAGTRVEGPNQTSDQGDVIEIGQTEFSILYTPQAHSDTDLMIQVLPENLLFLGDNGLNGRLGQLTHATFKGSIEALNQALETKAGRFVPGHGPVGDSSIVIQYRDYLVRLREEVGRLLEEGLADYEIKPLLLEQFSAYHDWVGFDDEFGRHIGLVYLEVESESF